MQVFESVEGVAVSKKERQIDQAQAFSQGPLAKTFASFWCLLRVRARSADPAMRAGISVVEHNQGAVAAARVGIGKDVFIHMALVGIEIEQQEIAYFSKQVPA